MIRSKRPSAGFTLLEILITVTLVGLLMASLSSAFQSTGGTFRTVTSAMNLEVQGTRAMHNILNGLRWADGDSLSVVPATPFFASEIEFVQNTGFDGTSTGWSDPIRIGLDATPGEVVWTENPGLAGERRLDRIQFVAKLQAGETENGLDDNGNGLVDEPGFCVTRQDDVLTLSLTLEGTDHSGSTHTRSFTTRLYCRN